MTKDTFTISIAVIAVILLPVSGTIIFLQKPIPMDDLIREINKRLN